MEQKHEPKKEAQPFQERQTAKIVAIKDLITGTYVKTPGEFTPNYVQTRYREQVARANVIGIVIGKNQTAITIDDGSERITARSFEAMPVMEAIAIGDIVEVIGRPREFNNTVYLLPEIIKKVKNTKMIEWRMLELHMIEKKREKEGIKEQLFEQEKVFRIDQQPQIEKMSEEKIVEEVVDGDKTDNPKKKINEKNPFEKFVEVVKKNDKGDGADIETVIAQFLGDGEKLLKILLEEGEVFEMKPGKIKVLE